MQPCGNRPVMSLEPKKQSARGRGRSRITAAAKSSPCCCSSPCDDFSADRGLDNAPQKKRLWDKWNIWPLIDTRLLWQAEKEEPGYDPGRPIMRALLPDRADVVVHDERGRVSCICPKTGEERALAFQGFEADRGACGTLKYRCLRLRVRGPRRVPPCGRGGARRVRA